MRHGACVSILRVRRRHRKGSRGPRARSVRSREIPLKDHAGSFCPVISTIASGTALSPPLGPERRGA
jgi:hypothetical protein